MQSTHLAIWVFVVLIVVAVVAGLWYDRAPGELDSFAECLGEKGAVFYGAFWCPNCQNQKKLFGKSEKRLVYIECSTPDGKGQLPVCKDKKIEGYPTWEFTDGSREVGVVPLLQLAEKTECVLPQ